VGGAAVDSLPLPMGDGIEQEVLAIGQHPLGRQAPLGQQK
jgi:hypothetical protein